MILPFRYFVIITKRRSFRNSLFWPVAVLVVGFFLVRFWFSEGRLVRWFVEEHIGRDYCPLIPVVYIPRILIIVSVPILIFFEAVIGETPLSPLPLITLNIRNAALSFEVIH